MYLNILKKDLKRKKAMNIIVLVFIILATMFVSSSVNNILSVTTALDDYFEMADAPDYLVVTMNKNLSVDIEETVNSADAVERYTIEEQFPLSPENFIFENEDINIPGGTNMMMGMELSVDYIINPIELFLVFPLIIIVTTTISAFLTSFCTKRIKSSDTANIE